MFVACCCCCGIDPYDPTVLNSDDISIKEELALEAIDVENSSEGDLISMAKELNEYRNTMHDPKSTISVLRRVKERNMPAKLFSRLMSKTFISEEEADYIYILLQHNECIAKGLFDFVLAGGRLASLVDAISEVSNSPVVKLYQMFLQIVVAAAVAAVAVVVAVVAVVVVAVVVVVVVVVAAVAVAAAVVVAVAEEDAKYINQ